MASRTARKGTSRYKIRNWKQYEAGLIQRGSISFWINDDAIDQWRCCIKIFWNRFPNFSCFLPNSYGI